MSTVEVQKMLENCRQATLLEVQPKIEMLTQQLNILMKNMSSASQCPQGVSVGTPQSVSASCDILPTRNNYHSVDVYPITTIKMFVVAMGTAYLTTNEITIVHNEPLLPNNVKVMVDEVVRDAEEYLLLVLVLQYKTLGDVAFGQTQWPIHLIVLADVCILILVIN
nr:uncharacterized protein LOC109183092 [Ipomoea batatas]